MPENINLSPISQPHRTVWIVGASSGIGAALARAFASEGSRCTLSSRNMDALERVRLGCNRPDEHAVVPLDVTDPDTIAGAVAAVRGGGPIDLLVLASGISQRATAIDTEMAVVRRIMETNFFGPIAVARLVLPDMVSRGSGRVVVISSVSGRVATPMRSAYAASKHALHGWVESARAELHDAGVRFTLVCPGFVRTEISRNALRADGSAHAAMDRAQARGMDPDECARRILRAIARGRDEFTVGGRETFGVHLFRFAPGLLRRVVRSHRPS